VTCHDARELFSALLDETLTREERADVYAHLSTCAECRRELEALERTVALVRGATPVRAPAGFVDRVVEAARPRPWYRRAARAALLPWPIKLPLSAAALLLVGGLAVLVVRGTREPERAAQTVPAAPAAPAPETLSDRAVAERPEREHAQAKSEAPAAPPGADERRDTAIAGRAESPRATLSEAAGPDVVARLPTAERDTTERGLAALAARLAGVQTGRRVAGDVLVVELAIPRDRYEDFRREAARLGDYRTESEPPTLPDTVRIAVHLGS
jgi:anti-sigma factor RsiW